MSEYEGTEHRRDACATALGQQFMQWIPVTLHAAGAFPEESTS
jgi:hypothetical protein